MTAAEQITYDRGDSVWWTDIHGEDRGASVERINGERIDIRIGDLGTVVEVHRDELSPR